MLAIDRSTEDARLGNSLLAKADSSKFAFAGDFTVEVFKYKFAGTGNQVLLANWQASGNQRSWSVQYVTGALHFSYSTNGSTALNAISYTWSPTLGTEYDIAVDRSGSTLRLYIDGVMVASGTLSGALHQSTAANLGVGQNSDGTTPTTGRCKAIRITQVARYATNGSYTVPSLPLPTS